MRQQKLYPHIVQIILVCRPEEMGDMARLIKGIPAGWQWNIVEGGAQRHLSVNNGVKAVVEDVDLIAVHDAVRPFVLQSTVIKSFETAMATGGALVGVFATDTIKVVSGSGKIINTPPRSTLFHAQTPQVFKRKIFIDCNRDIKEGITYTDDCSLLEAGGYPIEIVEGSPDNIKITTPEDLIQAEAILANRRKTL